MSAISTIAISVIESAAPSGQLRPAELELDEIADQHVLAPAQDAGSDIGAERRDEDQDRAAMMPAWKAAG